MSLIADPKDVLRDPPSARLVFVSLLLAFLIYLLPTGGSLIFLRPELPLIVLIYWCIHHPRYGGFLVGFIIGLLVDVADGNILGQHALAYTMAIFFTLVLRLRILKFKLWQQALHVLAILLASQVLVVITHLFLSTTFPGWGYFLASFVGTLFWPAISIVLEYPQILAANANKD